MRRRANAYEPRGDWRKSSARRPHASRPRTREKHSHHTVRSHYQGFGPKYGIASQSGREEGRRDIACCQSSSGFLGQAACVQSTTPFPCFHVHKFQARATLSTDSAPNSATPLSSHESLSCFARGAGLRKVRGRCNKTR